MARRDERKIGPLKYVIERSYRRGGREEGGWGADKGVKEVEGAKVVKERWGRMRTPGRRPSCPIEKRGFRYFHGITQDDLSLNRA